MTQQRILFICLASSLFFATSLRAQAPDWVWAASGGGSQVEYSHFVTTDPMGNVYITGSFEGTAQFSGNALVSHGMADVFVAKYDSSGTLVWIRQGGSDQIDEGLSVAADAAGNCYVSGAFRDTAVFDGDTLVSTNTLDMFFARYDSSGTLTWLKKVGNRSYGGSVTTDGDSHIFLTGRFQGTGIFDTIALVANAGGGTDAFLVQFDSTGAAQWARKGGGPANDQCYASATDNSGSTYLVGEFTGAATFGSLPLTGSGPYGSVFVVKYDHNGNALWVNRGICTDLVVGYSVGADSAGNCFVSGLFRDTVSFDSLSLINPSASLLHAFVVRFDTAGHAMWANRAYASTIIDSRSLAVDANGDCYISGFFAGTSTFGALSMNSTLGFADAFVAKYDAGGTVEWIQKGGGNASESDGVISLDAQGNVYMTGRYSSSSSLFGTHALPFPAGSADAFLAKLGSTIVTEATVIHMPGSASLYPNPSGNQVVLSGLPPGTEPGSIHVLDVSGRNIAVPARMQGKDAILDISAVAPGIYFIRIAGRTDTAPLRMVRE